MSTSKSKLGGMTIWQLFAHLEHVRSEIQRIDSLQGNTNDMDWEQLRDLDEELSRTLDAIDLMHKVTLDEVRSVGHGWQSKPRGH